MLTFPNAKINLGLNILSKRPDGYHNIESCFYPIPWKDVLEIIPADTFQFDSSGLDIPGDPSGNLCIKAYVLLKAAFDIPAVKIHLHKVIPMGAGLGGGSADGAFTLKLLNHLFELGLTVDKMENLASQLGSDCPFFIKGKPTLATGTGTSFKDTSLDLSGKYIALLNPGIHIGTQEAYSAVNPKKPITSISSILSMDQKSWKDALKNDFEDSVFPNHPELPKIKDELYQAGAFYASMSGSGSTIFGVFDQKPNLNSYQTFQL